MKRDLIGTTTWEQVSEFFRRLYEPGFGLPTDLSEVDVRPGTREIVATAVVRDGPDGEGRRSIVTVRDGLLTAVTAGTAESYSARWSCDGEFLAFLSERPTRGVSQLQLLSSTAAREAAEVSVPGTVEQLAWAPAGHRVLLRVASVSEAGPGPASPVVRGCIDDAPAWMPRVEGGCDTAPARTLWLADADGCTARQVTNDELTIWEIGWAGPGRAVAITSAGRTDNDWYGAGLSVIDLESGKHETVLTSDVHLGLPAGSPDGRHIAVVQAISSDRYMTVGDLLLLDDSGGQRVLATCGVDVSYLRWLDGTRLSFAGLRGLNDVVGVVDISTGEATELWCSPEPLGAFRQPDATVLPDGAVVASRQGYRLPPGIAVHEHGITTEIASTAHPGTADILDDIGYCERVSWTAADGWEIDGLLAKPATPGPYALIVSVHGGPVWAWRERWLLTYVWVPLLVSRGYAVLYPNPRGSTGKGQRFQRAVVGDMGGADAQDILAGIDSLAEAGVIDPDRVGLMGESYGGFMTNWLITQDQRFKAAVPAHVIAHWPSQHYSSVLGAFDEIFLEAQPGASSGPYYQRSPLTHVDRVTTPALHVAGALDPYTHPSESLLFHRALAARGVESALAVYPTEGHGVRSYMPTLDLCARLVDLFETHMPAQTDT